MRARYRGEPVQIVNRSAGLVCVMMNDGITFWVAATEVEGITR